MANQKSGQASGAKTAVRPPSNQLSQTNASSRTPTTSSPNASTSKQGNSNSRVNATGSAVTTKPKTNQQATGTQNAIVLCGFAAIGKSTFFREACKKGGYNGVPVIDLDSGDYSKEESKYWSKERPFPLNYLDAIRERLDDTCILMISTHKSVYSQLLKNGTKLVIVYPKKDLRVKAEWEKRITERDKVQRVKNSMWPGVDTRWDQWIKEYEEHAGQYRNCLTYTMSTNENLSTAAGRIPVLRALSSK